MSVANITEDYQEYFRVKKVVAKNCDQRESSLKCIHDMTTLKKLHSLK